MDYNSEGEWENETGWTNFDDNNYPIKILPHVPVDGGNIFDSDIKRTDNGQTLSFSNYGFYKMNQSWEENQSQIIGQYYAQDTVGITDHNTEPNFRNI